MTVDWILVFESDILHTKSVIINQENWTAGWIQPIYFFYFLFFVIQEAQYGQGYGQQGAPTSFSNQMWADRKKVRLWRLSEVPPCCI